MGLATCDFCWMISLNRWVSMHFELMVDFLFKELHDFIIHNSFLMSFNTNRIFPFSFGNRLNEKDYRTCSFLFDHKSKCQCQVGLSKGQYGRRSETWLNGHPVIANSQHTTGPFCLLHTWYRLGNRVLPIESILFLVCWRRIERTGTNIAWPSIKMWLFLPAELSLQSDLQNESVIENKTSNTCDLIQFDSIRKPLTPKQNAPVLRCWAAIMDRKNLIIMKKNQKLE